MRSDALIEALAERMGWNRPYLEHLATDVGCYCGPDDGGWSECADGERALHPERFWQHGEVAGERIVTLGPPTEEEAAHTAMIRGIWGPMLEELLKPSFFAEGIKVALHSSSYGMEDVPDPNGYVSFPMVRDLSE